MTGRWTPDQVRGDGYSGRQGATAGRNSKRPSVTIFGTEALPAQILLSRLL